MFVLTQANRKGPHLMKFEGVAIGVWQITVMMAIAHVSLCSLNIVALREVAMPKYL